MPDTIKRDSIGISVTATLLFYLDTLTSPIPLFQHCHNNIFPFNDLLQYLTVDHREIQADQQILPHAIPQPSYLKLFKMVHKLNSCPNIS